MRKTLKSETPVKIKETYSFVLVYSMRQTLLHVMMLHALALCHSVIDRTYSLLSTAAISSKLNFLL